MAETTKDFQLTLFNDFQSVSDSAVSNSDKKLTLADTICTVGPFWDIYCEVKKHHENKFVFIKVNDGYFSFNEDAEQVSSILHIKLSNRDTIGLSHPLKVCFLSNETFDDRFAELGDLGVGIVLADWEPGVGISTFILNSAKKQISLADQILTASAHTAKSHFSDRAPAKESTPER